MNGNAEVFLSAVSCRHHNTKYADRAGLKAGVEDARTGILQVLTNQTAIICVTSPQITIVQEVEAESSVKLLMLQGLRGHTD